MNIIAIVILLAAVCNFLLGFLILIREKNKTRLSWIFGAFCFAFSLWVLSNFLLIILPKVFFLKSTYALGALASCISVFWVLEISGKKITKLKFAIFSSVGLFFTIASYFLFKVPSLTVQEIGQLYASGFEIKSSAVFFGLYTFYLAGIFFYLIFTLISGYLRAQDIRKKQIGYVLIGVVLNCLSILVASFILPIFGLYQYSFLFDSPSSLALVFFSALAISRYHLFELKVILTEILVVAMGVVLFLLPFTMRERQFVILTSIIFVFFCLFGYLLIKGSYKEVKQKEILEQTVKERTKSLEQSRQNLIRTLEDVDQAKAKAELERDKTMKIINNLADGLILIEEGQFTLVNPRAQKLLNTSERSIVGTKINAATTNENMKMLIKMIQETQGLLYKKKLNLEKLILEVSSVPILGIKKEPIEMVILRDLSSKKE